MPLHDDEELRNTLLDPKRNLRPPPGVLMEPVETDAATNDTSDEANTNAVCRRIVRQEIARFSSGRFSWALFFTLFVVFRLGSANAFEDDELSVGMS